MTLRAFVLRGPGAELALDRLHVLAEVQGAIVGDGEVTVWLDGPLPELGELEVRCEELPPERVNVTATGLEQDRPILVADDLLVRPPWVERPQDFSGIELVVPRGMAFGSGEHASTQAALLVLHRAWASPASLADVGTGSGILALYASVRGCRSVFACDIEDESVKAARELLPQATVTLGGPGTIARPCDCVVANMMASELLAAWTPLLALWTGRSHLVLSGIRAHELDSVRSRLPAPATALTVGDFTALLVEPQRR